MCNVEGATGGFALHFKIEPTSVASALKLECHFDLQTTSLLCWGILFHDLWSRHPCSPPTSTSLFFLSLYPFSSSTVLGSSPTSPGISLPLTPLVHTLLSPPPFSATPVPCFHFHPSPPWISLPSWKQRASPPLWHVRGTLTGRTCNHGTTRPYIPSRQLLNMAVRALRPICCGPTLIQSSRYLQESGS